MTYSGTYKFRRFLGKTAIIAVVFSMSQYVFAIDGTLGGGKNTSKSTFSTLKKDLNLSLKSGYTFNGNKTLGSSKSQKGMLNSVISYHKGNITYYMPYKNKPILQKFKTPSASVIR
ncbi:MAG: hypothetical protein MUE58_09475 [Chitinophagaceae bacterium]|jgi:hypothetical protein|nr:hypothetical protein [Chitinophagaceae bacterium]